MENGARLGLCQLRRVRNLPDLETTGLAIKGPLIAHFLLVGHLIPIPQVLLQGCKCWKTATAETLTCDQVQFEFGLVEPAFMFRCGMHANVLP